MEARATSPLWYASHCQEVGYHPKPQGEPGSKKEPPNQFRPRRDEPPRQVALDIHVP